MSSGRLGANLWPTWGQLGANLGPTCGPKGGSRGGPEGGQNRSRRPGSVLGLFRCRLGAVSGLFRGRLSMQLGIENGTLASFLQGYKHRTRQMVLRGSSAESVRNWARSLGTVRKLSKLRRNLQNIAENLSKSPRQPFCSKKASPKELENRLEVARKVTETAGPKALEKPSMSKSETKTRRRRLRKETEERNATVPKRPA